MPRLVGKKTNSAVWIFPLIAVVAVGAIAKMEYTGAVDFVPQFGRSSIETID